MKTLTSSASRIIVPRQHIDRVSYKLTCEHVDAITRKVIEPGWGFGFDCDANGNPLPGMAPAALANLRKCQSGAIPVTPLTLERSEWVEHVPAVMLCDCGRKLTLNSGWANDCDCGRSYNGSAQLLADRSQWGEETGEQF